MLFEEIVAVYFDNYTEQTVTLCGKAVLDREHDVYATKRSWLLLFGKTVAVCCENHTEHADTR
jgi:hypothetical protein